MEPTRRDFLKGVGVAAALPYVAHDVVSDILATSRRGNAYESKFKALADVVLGEARLAGFTAYVAPGQHTVVLEPGSPRESRQVLEVAAGQAAVVGIPCASILSFTATGTPYNGNAAASLEASASASASAAFSSRRLMNTAGSLWTRMR